MNPFDPTTMDQTDATEPLEAALENELMASDPPDTTLDAPSLESIETAADILPAAAFEKDNNEPTTKEKTQRTSATEVLEDLRERRVILSNILEDNERLKLLRITNKINMSYYQLWSTEANKTFRLLVTFSKRARRLKNGQRSN